MIIYNRSILTNKSNFIDINKPKKIIESKTMDSDQESSEVCEDNSIENDSFIYFFYSSVHCV